MSVSHVGGPPGLAIVSSKLSQTSTPSDTTALDRSLLPDMRKILPDQAKGAAKGLSVQKVFDKWDADGDGTITAAEAGPRWGHGILGQLLKLQEDGAEPDGVETPTTEALAGSPDPAADPDAATPPPASSDGAEAATGDTATGDTATGDAAGDVPPVDDGAGTETADETSASDGTDPAASLTPPPPTGGATPDPSEILDDSTA
jgi:hypothetical protein